MSKPNSPEDQRRIDRRRFLTTFALGAGAVPLFSLGRSLLAGSGAPVAPSLCYSNAGVLKQSDFSYLGCMRMPTSVDTMFSYGGLTGRTVGGELRLFVFGNNPTLKDPVFELADTGSYDPNYQSAPRMRLVQNWGDIYQGRRTSWTNSGTQLTLQYMTPGGLYWNENTQLLYWTYYDSYNSVVRPDWNLGASRLDNSTGAVTSFGPWRTLATDGDNVNWFGASRCAILMATPDGKMGGAGAYFVTTAAPWGPQLFSGADWPTAATPSGFGQPDLRLRDRYLNYYFMGGKIDAATGRFSGPLRSFRRPSPAGYVWHPTNGIATEIDPTKNGGIGSWTNEDGLGGATWIDLPDKRGVVFAATFAGGPNANAATCGTGHIWYRNTGVGTDKCTHGCSAPVDIAGPVTDAAFPALVVYDPDDLAAVRSGNKTDYTVEPTSIINLDAFGIKTAPITALGQAKSVRGFHFDATRRLLFIRSAAADESTPGLFTDLIHVFRIN